MVRALDDLETQLTVERFAEVYLLTKILQLQLESPRPRKSILRSVLVTLSGITTGVLGNVVYAQLMSHLQ
jgi:hypothetical protein